LWDKSREPKTPRPNLRISNPPDQRGSVTSRGSAGAPRQAQPTPSPQSPSSHTEAAEAAWTALIAKDPNGPLLQKLASNAASKNKTGKQSATARWNQIGRLYEKLLEGEHSPEAVRYALNETVRREAVSINYTAKVLANNPTGKPAARRAKKNPAMYMDVSLNHEQKIKYWGTYEDGERNLTKSVPDEYLEEVLAWRVANGRSIPGPEPEPEPALTDEELQRRWEASPF